MNERRMTSSMQVDEEEELKWSEGELLSTEADSVYDQERKHLIGQLAQVHSRITWLIF